MNAQERVTAFKKQFNCNGEGAPPHMSKLKCIVVVRKKYDGKTSFAKACDVYWVDENGCESYRSSRELPLTDAQFSYIYRDCKKEKICNPSALFSERVLNFKVDVMAAKMRLCDLKRKRKEEGKVVKKKKKIEMNVAYVQKKSNL